VAITVISESVVRVDPGEAGIALGGDSSVITNSLARPTVCAANAAGELTQVP